MSRCPITYDGGLLICEKEAGHEGELHTAVRPKSSIVGPGERVKWASGPPKRPLDPDYERRMLLQNRLINSPAFRGSIAKIIEALEAA